LRRGKSDLVMKNKYFMITIALLLLWGCGKRTRLPTDAPPPAAGAPDTTYVPLPSWTSAGGVPFDGPEDVHVGFDGRIYIADTENDRIVKLDAAGNFLAQYLGVQEPWSVSQDRLLRLQATGGNTIYVKSKDLQTFEALYTAPDFYDTTILVLPDTLIDTLIISPDSIVIDTTIGLFDTTYIVDTTVTSLKAIAADPRPISDSASYFVCDHTRNRIDRFIYFEPGELYRRGVAVPEGFDLSETMYPTGVFTYLGGTGFKLLFCHAHYIFSVQLLDGDDFTPLIPRTDSSEIYWGNWIIGKPEDAVVDEFENIFVADIRKHRIHKFSRNGVHILSFGEPGSGYTQLNNPRGIAYDNKILYVADTDNNRIQRFMLSTDFPH
jgi:hypothetical protein